MARPRWSPGEWTFDVDLGEVYAGEEIVAQVSRVDDVPLIGSAKELLGVITEAMAGSDECFFCRSYKAEGHARNCKAAAVLRKINGE